MIKLESGFYESSLDLYDTYDIRQSTPNHLSEENVVNFFTRLIGEDNEFISIEKYDPSNTPSGYNWAFVDGNKILEEISKESFTNHMFAGYLMEDGSVFCVYKGPDCGGYDVESKLVKYENLTEFKNAVLFGSQL